MRDDHFGYHPREVDPPVHIGTESAFDYDVGCQLPEPGSEVHGDQCDACGSFYPDGTPGTPYIFLGRKEGVECKGCGAIYPVRIWDEDELEW